MLGQLKRFRLPLIVLACVAALGGDPSGAAEPVPDSLLDAVKKSERILAGFFEEDIEVATGKPLLIEIERALRGAGARGTRARVIQGGEDGMTTKYKGRRLYIFLLVKGGGGKGWASLGTNQLEVQKGNARWLAAGNPPYEMPLAELEALIESTTVIGSDNAPKRDSMQGRWLVYFAERGVDIAGWLVDFQPDPQGGFTTKLMEGSLGSSTMNTEHVDPPVISLDFVVNAAALRFRGRFAEGAVRGSIQTVQGLVVPAWLVPTELESLEPSRTPRPSLGQPELLDATKAEEPLAELLRFVRRFKDQPSGLDGYLTLLPLAISEFPDSEKLRPLLESYVEAAAMWGPELALRAMVDSAIALSRSDNNAELGLEFADRATRHFTETTPPGWVTNVRRMRGPLLIAAGREKEGVEHLRKVKEDQAFDPEINWLISQYALKNDQLEEALELLGEIVALPGLEGGILSVVARAELSSGKRPPPQVIPSRLVEKTWKLLKKPEGGLPKYLDAIYERKVRGLAGAPRKPRAAGDGNRVVLLELFTGAQCVPCIAVDVATTALQSEFAHSEAIVLRFHQHSPGPDPLANPETLARFISYQGDATPTLFINGRAMEGVGGTLVAAPELIGRIRERIIPYLDEVIDLRLELSAVAKGDVVQIQAKGLGLPKFPKEVRMRLALAEEKIAMPARNGIRLHEMIVRHLPGEAAGIQPRDGKLEYQESTNVSEFRARILDYLHHVELESNQKFDRKPVDLTKLVLVGWLQNDDTGEVLQAAAVRLEGKLNPPEAAQVGSENGSAVKNPKAVNGEKP